MKPTHVQAHFLSALIAVQQGRLEQARSYLDTVCTIDPAHAQAAMLRGHVLDRLGDPVNAVASLDMAAALMPGSAMLWNYRAQALFSLKRYDEALACCDRALSLTPGRTDTAFLRGVLLQMLGRFSQAMRTWDQLLEASPADAGTHELIARGLLAGVGHGRPEAELLCDALKYADTAIALQPDRGTAHEVRASVLERCGDILAALASYRQALRLRPELDDASYGMGRCLLALGDWKDGWLAHERRWFRPHHMAWRRDTGAPLWLGESLTGKSIAIVAERGFGDVIQFFRFVESVRLMAASVSLVLPRALQRLLTPAEAEGPAGPFDYHCPLLSLPHRLGTTPLTVPGTQGYLRADPALAAPWRQRLGPATRPRIGLVWRGDPAHGNDHNRSMPLAQLARLLDIADAEFVSLQQVMPDADQPAHAAWPQLAFHGPQLHDFAETAALCDAMDLVISVDTSVAHLAGALGKPVWILLPAIAEWRWMQDREDSPWYARARLFRQTRQGDWDGVVSRVRESLLEFIGAAPAAR